MISSPTHGTTTESPGSLLREMEKLKSIEEARRLEGQIASLKAQIDSAGGTAKSNAKEYFEQNGKTGKKGKNEPIVLNYLKEHPGKTHKEIIEGTGINSSSVYLVLRRNEEASILTKDNGGRWFFK